MKLKIQQQIIMELIVNPQLAQLLKVQPEKVCELLNLNSNYLPFIKKINWSQLNNFRSIVEGTRTHRISEALSLTQGYLKGTWSSLLKEFFNTECIRDHQFEADLIQFTIFLENKLQQDYAGLILLKFERAMIVASDDRLSGKWTKYLMFKTKISLDSLTENLQLPQYLDREIKVKFEKNIQGEVEVYEVH